MATKTTQPVTQLLRERHHEVEGMFQQMATTTGAERRELFDCLRATLAVHETAEEMVVHPAARKLGDDAVAVVEARLREETEAKRALAELEGIGPDGPGFAGRFQSFRAAVLAHAEAEERELFPMLDRGCDEDQLRHMTDRVLKAERMAPTHAHPHAPGSAVGNMLVGPFVAMVDKVRDALAKDD
jgi:hemerythrin superfamily protein